MVFEANLSCHDLYAGFDRPLILSCSNNIAQDIFTFLSEI